jgi:hypothetical protein
MFLLLSIESAFYHESTKFGKHENGSLTRLPALSGDPADRVLLNDVVVLFNGDIFERDRF